MITKEPPIEKLREYLSQYERFKQLRLSPVSSSRIVAAKVQTEYPQATYGATPDWYTEGNLEVFIKSYNDHFDKYDQERKDKMINSIGDNDNSNDSLYPDTVGKTNIVYGKYGIEGYCRAGDPYAMDHSTTQSNPQPFNPISKPAHYATLDPEPITVIENWKLPYHLGCVIKYIARADKKENYLQDLKKSLWYLTRHIERIETTLKQEQESNKD